MLGYHQEERNTSISELPRIKSKYLWNLVPINLRCWWYEKPSGVHEIVKAMVYYTAMLVFMVLWGRESRRCYFRNEKYCRTRGKCSALFGNLWFYGITACLNEALHLSQFVSRRHLANREYKREEIFPLRRQIWLTNKIHNARCKVM